MQPGGIFRRPDIPRRPRRFSPPPVVVAGLYTGSITLLWGA